MNGMKSRVVLAMIVLTLFALGGGDLSAQKTALRKTPKVAQNPAGAAVERVAQNNPVSQPAKTLLPDIVAEVNGEKITKEQLAAESLRIHGAETLDRILHRTLVLAECKRKQIHVTRDDVNAEIGRLAKANRITPEELLQSVLADNNMTAEQYGEDVIWPMLALKTLVASEIEVTPEELDREYMKQFGPSVGAQMIMAKTKEAADAILARVQAAPDTFGDIAKNESTDLSTAANKGRMQPIRRYTLPDPKLEETLFAMKPGEISGVVGPCGPNNDYMIFKCEQQYESVVPKEKIEQIKESLKTQAVNQKLKGAAAALFEKLDKEAKVVNVLNDPEMRKQYPNVAAMVNGQPVYLDAVIEKCLHLYARQDLEMMIHFTLIRQECKKAQINISDADIETEIWTRAAECTMPLPDGKPNIAEYIKNELASYQVPEAVYRSNIVWPALAVKKLSAPLVKVTDEDLQKGFEANFGEMVQCLGIVLRDQRLAQDVWQKARTLPDKQGRTLEDVFGELASQYSVEPGSRQMKGRINPINRHGGSPQLEEEAFRLKPGELSSIIQVDRETFVILYCQEILPAKEVTFEEAKETIQSSVQKKMEMLAADQYYNDLLKRSAVNNFLTGQNLQPKSKTIIPPPAK